MSIQLLYSILLYLLGHTFVWFEINSQFVWEYWKDKPLLSAVLYAVPTSMCFWYATKIAHEELGSLWAPRFLAFSASWIIFPYLTYYFLNESMFTAKTMVCVALSMMIMAVQIFWK